LCIYRTLVTLKSCLIDWLIDCLLFFVSLKNNSLIYGDVTIAGERLQNARRSGPLSREGSLSCYICCDTGLRLSCPIWRIVPFSRILQHTRGCGGPIITTLATSAYVAKKVYPFCVLFHFNFKISCIHYQTIFMTLILLAIYIQQLFKLVSIQHTLWKYETKCTGLIYGYLKVHITEFKT
jgi:hypothetical protein